MGIDEFAKELAAAIRAEAEQCARLDGSFESAVDNMMIGIAARLEEIAERAGPTHTHIEIVTNRDRFGNEML